jgi:hypothetical protein
MDSHLDLSRRREQLPSRALSLGKGRLAGGGHRRRDPLSGKDDEMSLLAKSLISLVPEAGVEPAHPEG